MACLGACRTDGTLTPPPASESRAEDADDLPGFGDGSDSEEGIDRFYVKVGDAPFRGPADAEVTVVMFSDFECPFCLQGHETLESLRRLYPKQVRTVYKAFPLGNHPHALLAAMAARTAQAHGRFWDFHDLLFSQRGIDPPTIFGYAKKVGLDLETLDKELGELKWAPEVRRDIRQARQLGVHSTPTFFVNGVHVSGAKPIEDFTTLVDAELRRTKQWLDAGVPRKDIYEKAIADGYRKVVYEQRRGLDPDAVFVVPLGDSPSKGPANAPITIVAFGDFECPFCARGAETMERLEKAYPGQLRFVYKHSPMPMHSHAFIAARASMIAHLQGKFWPYHDKLYALRSDFDLDDLKRIADEVGLDKKKFAKALDGHELDPAIEADLGLAMALGVSGTPAYFVNGRPVEGAVPELEFRMMFAEEFARVAAAKKRGITDDQIYETLTHEPLD